MCCAALLIAVSTARLQVRSPPATTKYARAWMHMCMCVCSSTPAALKDECSKQSCCCWNVSPAPAYLHYVKHFSTLLTVRQQATDAARLLVQTPLASCVLQQSCYQACLKSKWGWGLFGQARWRQHLKRSGQDAVTEHAR